jgi:hypothetical protein
MENFIGYDFKTEENVSIVFFNEIIAEAIEHLIKSNDLSMDSIKQIRHTYNQECLVNGRHFIGQYLTFEILKEANIPRHLHCFIANNNEYMEIIAS